MNDKVRPITLNDLGQLTLRANVAFAVRCAERLRPNFELPADAAHRREQMAALDDAIRVATEFCLDLAREAGQAAAAAEKAAQVADETSEVNQFAGFGAVRAAEAAAHAEDFVSNPDGSGITNVVASAFGAGRVLVANANAFIQDMVLAALQADMEKLISMGRGHGNCETLGPPIDPSESGPLGPLWPGGAPMRFT